MKKKVEELIMKALETLAEFITEGNCTDKEWKSRIIIPKYRGQNKTRYSEQELKQVFLHFIEQSDYYYSVETPSQKVYSISNSEIPEVKSEEDDHCESARIDVSLYYKSNDNKRLFSHIEFKYGNPSNSNVISKDFLRLTNEMGENKNNFFVHYIVRESDVWKTKTLPSVLKKYIEAMNNPGNIDDNLDKVCIYFMIIKKLSKDNPTKIIYKFNLKELKELNASNEELLKWIDNKKI